MEQSDKNPNHVIEIIDKAFCQYILISPNKGDTVKRRHPLNQTQVEEKQAMHQYKSIDELWNAFKTDHSELAHQLQNNN
eukprot:11487283-Ditylum_brightwellii.AAC.1